MVHQGHRHRMRERFQKEGLEGFAPHEVLELLLFYAIPQKDVNPLAHRLIDTFGSLHGVLEASPQQLSQVEGIGEYAATLLALILPVCRSYGQSAATDQPLMTNRKQAEEFFRKLFLGLREERFYCVMLNAKGGVLGTALIAKGSVNQVPAYPRQVVDAVLRFNAHSVVLCHNHPGGTLAPSADDLEATVKIAQVLHGIDVYLLDHMIVGAQEVYSMRREGLFETPAARERALAAEKPGSIADLTGYKKGK